MKNPRSELADIDRVPVPDEWSDIRHRPLGAPTGLDHTRTTSKRVLAALVSIAIASAGTMVAYRAFRTDRTGVVAGGTVSSSPRESGGDTTQASLPSGDSVQNGRFIEDVNLDDGAFRVDVAPDTVMPSISQADAESLVWSSPEFQGIRDGSVLGFGLVSTSLPGPGGETISTVPAWVAFAWGSSVFCPENVGSFDPSRLPSSGYSAVVVGMPKDASDPFTYAAETSTCFNSPSPPTVAPATHIVSVGWSQDGGISNGEVSVRYALPDCSKLFKIDVEGSGSTATILVEVEAPVNESPSCAASSVQASTVDLSPGDASFSPTIVAHGPLGSVKQIQKQP